MAHNPPAGKNTNGASPPPPHAALPHPRVTSSEVSSDSQVAPPYGSSRILWPPPSKPSRPPALSPPPKPAPPFGSPNETIYFPSSTSSSELAQSIANLLYSPGGGATPPVVEPLRGNLTAVNQLNASETGATRTTIILSVVIAGLACTIGVLTLLFLRQRRLSRSRSLLEQKTFKTELQLPRHASVGDREGPQKGESSWGGFLGFERFKGKAALGAPSKVVENTLVANVEWLASTSLWVPGASQHGPVGYSVANLGEDAGTDPPSPPPQSPGAQGAGEPSPAAPGAAASAVLDAGWGSWDGKMGALYKKVGRLGRGSSGSCHLVLHREARQLYALKSVPYSTATFPSVLQEARLLSTLRHANVVRHLATHVDEACCYIVMEYCTGGDLGRVVELQRARGTPLKERWALGWAAQAAAGLAYLHERRILHRDFKTRNLFLTGAGVVKLGDLGVAKELVGSLQTANTVTGTPLYMAPCVICSPSAEQCDYSWSLDVWSLGVVLYELATLHRPFGTIAALRAFADAGPDAARAALERGPLGLAVAEEGRPSAAQDALWPVVQRLLQLEPAARPSAREAHELLSQLAEERSASGVAGEEEEEGWGLSPDSAGGSPDDEPRRTITRAAALLRDAGELRRGDSERSFERSFEAGPWEGRGLADEHPHVV